MGITNNSILPEALRLRRCVMKHPSLGSHLVQLAKVRGYRCGYHSVGWWGVPTRLTR